MLLYTDDKVFSRYFQYINYNKKQNSNSRWSSWLWHPAVIVYIYRVVPGSIPGLEIKITFLGPTLENLRHPFFVLIYEGRKNSLLCKNKVDFQLFALRGKVEEVLKKIAYKTAWIPRNTERPGLCRQAHMVGRAQLGKYCLYAHPAECIQPYQRNKTRCS